MDDKNQGAPMWALKITIAWLGSMSVQEWVQISALIFTLLQIWVLLRDKVLRLGKRRDWWRADPGTKPTDLDHHEG